MTLSTATGAAATAGTHAITTSGGTAANYAITDVNGTLTVSKAAALTVTADNKSKVYGAADPALTDTVTGTFYYGDGPDVVSGVTLSTTIGAAATAGTHTIIVTGGTAANYAISDVNGTLTVSKAPLTVTADDKSKVYGAADPALTYTPSGTLYYGDTYAVIGGVTLSTTTGAAATAGTHTITASGGSGGQLRHHRRQRHAHRLQSAADGYRGRQEQGLRRCRPDADLHAQRHALLRRHLRSDQRGDAVHRHRRRGHGRHPRDYHHRRHGG